jgi:hypothetical protein
MNMDAAKSFCDLAAAGFALMASAAWCKAARQPVALPGPAGYAPQNRDDPYWKKLAAAGDRIKLGSTWNQRAAMLTGLSAFSTFLSWLFQWLHSS